MCQNMSRGYREPSTRTDRTSSSDSGALFVARAIEYARIIAAIDSDTTETIHARLGATIQPITITTSGIMNCRSPGRSNRFRTCQRKNRRTIVSPLDGAR